MTSGTGKRPFSMLGDQQLLEQTRRLAANRRALEVHILDHLDEIDRRNLALRRGFSSLFDYAVRELRFSDAAAQRRIQTMRLCRRHGWVRAKLQSGELSLTSAAQFETAFAAAERQCRRASPNVGQERCHDLLGLPASPGVAGHRAANASGVGAGVASAAAMTASVPHGVVTVDQEAWSPCDAGGREDRHTGSDRCGPSSHEPAAVDARPAAAGAQPVGRLQSSAATSGAAPDSNTSASHAPPQAAPGRMPRARLAAEVAADMPVASHDAAQHRGAGHADTLPAWLESNGAASPSPAQARAPGPAATSSDQGPAAPLLPPASRAAPVPLPVVAPSEPRPAAALTPAQSRGERKPEPCSNPQWSAGPVSAAPLVHPRRQRELIERAAGMTTRQVAGLLASAAPQVAPPRDTLRAVAPDRFTLKVSIDQECEQGLRQLKDLLSHIDPRMSWGDLVARLVREALARHDPGGGGRGRKRAGGTVASSRRERTSTPSVVPAAAPVGRRGGDTPAPQSETAAGKQPRAAMSRNAALVRGVAPAARAPAAPARTTPAPAAPAAGAKALGTRAGAAASAMPAAAEAPEDQSADARVPCAAPRRPESAAPRMTAPAAPTGTDRQAGPSGAPEAAAAPQFAGSGPAHGTDATPVSSGTTSAPQSTRGGPGDGTDAVPIPPATTPALQFASTGPGDDAHAAPGPPGAPPAPELAGSLPPMRRAGGTPMGASPQFTGDAPRGPRRSPLRRPIPAAVRRHVWLRAGGRCCYRDPLTGRRCNSSHLLQIDHLLPVAEGGGPEPDNLQLACFAHHRMRHGYGPAPPSRPPR